MKMSPVTSVRGAVIILLTIFVSTTKAVPGPCALLDTGSSSICISIEEINQAFKKARLAFSLLEPVNFSPHKAHYHHHDIDRLGHVLVETSRIIAKNFKLDYEQVYELLPHLDLELTDIWKFCPKIFKDKNCKVSKYRTLSGHCNNINHPDWGAAITPFRYILHPDRPDGISEPREYGKDDSPLPPARLVSSTIHRDKVFHDHAVTTMLIAWGQIIDHDITFTAETKELSGKDPECCGETENIYDVTPKEKHPNCYPIRIPHDDSFYSYYNHHCMSFARSFAGVRAGCKLGPRVAFNTISSFLDASFVYGSNTEVGEKLRSGEYGLLKTLPLLKEHNLKDLLPLKTDEPDDGCIRPNSDIFCFFAGDNRVNEQLVLTTLHTIFVREHNSIAHALHEINPHWKDEKLYQETRKIIIGIVQHITFNEFLPMILGRDYLHEYGLSVEDGYWTGYDPHTDPSALEEFITSAYRFGHSLLPEKIERWSNTHHYIDSTKLHEMLRQPYAMFRPGYADSFIMGLVNQLAQVMDEGVTDQVTTLLFKEEGKSFGMDLAAMNIQRGRDHGVAPYAAFRKKCGLSPVDHWDDLIGVMRNETVHKYKYLYNSPWDIDLWSGGVSEISKPGSLLGPTFGCIIAKQFKNLRYGDRFWYELPDLPSSFTLDQLEEIKGMKLSRLLCDNGDNIKTIQLYAMVHPDHQINPRVSCYSKILPKLDLSKWRDTGELPDSQDSSGTQSVIQKAHLHTDLETLKPPLYDEAFIKIKELEKEREINDENPGWHSNSSSENHGDESPFPYEKFIPPFRAIPGEVPDIGDGIDGPPPPSAGPYDGGTLHDVFPDNEYNSKPPTSVNELHDPHGPAEPPPPPPPPRPRRKPSLLSLVRNRSIFGRLIGRTRRRPPPPYPPSPIPGMGGLYSPNPGYLVRQNFQVG